MPDVYLQEFEHTARRAFSMWNRELASASFGSFDREYWSWKYRDFSDATKQYAVRLAVEYARRAGQTAVLPKLLEGYVAFCRAVQRSDGSFDQCYPHERTPGVIYDILSTLVYVRQSPYLASPRLGLELEEVLRRAVRFALKVDEKHGQIANHIAQFAYELLHYAAYSGDENARRRGESYLDRLLSLLDRDEGWFQEYDGPDPGYQTRTLRFLAKCCLLLDRAELWKIAHKAADFVAALLMPDGSVHPMLGVRSTALLYPSAFEVLAARAEWCRPLAERVRAAWQERRVPLPSEIDFDNAMRLAADALDATEARAGYGSRPPTQPHPPEEIVPRTTFPRAGVSVFRCERHVTYLAHRLGGVVVVYGLDDAGRWKLLYEDSGYVLRSPDEKVCWVSRMPDAGRLIEQSDDRSLVRSEFYRSLHDEMTGPRLVMLRILNLTLLRVQWLADLFRKLVVKRLIGGRRRAGLVLLREVVIGQEEIRVVDRVFREPPRRSVEGRLFRCRRITGLHVASARYFQDQELEDLPLDWVQPVEWSAAAEVEHSVRVRLPAEGPLR